MLKNFECYYMSKIIVLYNQILLFELRLDNDIIFHLLYIHDCMKLKQEWKDLNKAKIKRKKKKREMRGPRNGNLIGVRSLV